MRKNEDCVAIYSRKSKYTGKGESIGNQVELCREYIRGHFEGVKEERILIYEDEGFSGGNLNRPDFKNMMEAAEKRRFRAIIVYRLDRISRNISDFSGLIEKLSRLDIAFVSIKEQFDTGTPMGRAMMYIASVFSQLERETIAERIRDNMHELAKTGRWLGGTTPTGYGSESVQTVTVDGKARKACKLRLIPEEAKKVRAIYELFLETGSLTVTEAELLRRRIVSKNGKDYTRFSIKAILQNPVYAVADMDSYGFFIKREAELFSGPGEFDGNHGILAYNRTDQEKGRATVYLPVKQWIVSVGQHPGIVPGKTWVCVQEMLEQNRSKAYRRPRRNEAILTGLLYCSCGSRMYPKLGKGENEEGKQLFSYVCRKKEHSQRSVCNGKNVSGNLLDAAVLQELKAIREEKETFLGCLEKERNLRAEVHDDLEEQLERLRQEKVELVRKMEALVDSLAEVSDCGARGPVMRRIERLDGECQAMEARIRELEGLRFAQVLGAEDFEKRKEMLLLFDGGLEGLPLEQRRAALRGLIRRVVWDGMEARVILAGADWEEEAASEGSFGGSAGEGTGDSLGDAPAGG